jgi:hypothetical protein
LPTTRLGRLHTYGGALAQKGDGVGIVEGRRRRVGGVGCFTRVGAAFYRGEDEARGRGVFNGRR